MTNSNNPHRRGLANMLEDSVSIAPGASVLVAYEDASLGWYDAELKDQVIVYCREVLSAEVESVEERPRSVGDGGVACGEGGLRECYTR